MFRVAVMMVAASAGAQTPAPDAGTPLNVVVAEARARYPLVLVTREEINASAARLALARTAYLPRVDGIAQFNRGTRNNVFGALLPQGVVPSMSGPVIGTNNSGSVWGSATGLLLQWQPFDFGARQANVAAARAAEDKARATQQRTELEVAAGSADAYLTHLASLNTRVAAEAAVRGWSTLKTSVHALVSAELRPGADESRVDAERAASLNQLALADQAVAVSQATLLKFAPKSGSPTLASKLQTALPDLSTVDEAFAPAQHPASAEQQALVKEHTAQLHAAERSWAPQVNLQAAGYARGTGAEVDGQRLSGANGLAPNVGNYVAGITITFPFLDLPASHARQQEQAALLHAATANQELTQRSLQEQFSQALAELKAADTIATYTPVEVTSAQAAFDQATARYKAGLTSVDDVAQAQRLLVQSQIDDAVARLSVWRAYLHLQFARGDLEPFLHQAAQY